MIYQKYKRGGNSYYPVLFYGYELDESVMERIRLELEKHDVKGYGRMIPYEISDFNEKFNIPFLDAFAESAYSRWEGYEIEDEYFTLLCGVDVDGNNSFEELKEKIKFLKPFEDYLKELQTHIPVSENDFENIVPKFFTMIRV